MLFDWSARERQSLEQRRGRKKKVKPRHVKVVEPLVEIPIEKRVRTHVHRLDRYTSDTQRESKTNENMGNKTSAYSGIDPSQFHLADSEGSLVLDFSDGTRVIAARRGTVMYILGHYLRNLNMFEDLLLRESQKISRPLPMFVSREDYVTPEYDAHEAARRGEIPIRPNHEKAKESADIATSNPETQQTSDTEDGDEEEGASKEAYIEEDEETRTARIEKELTLRIAIKQRKILRLVSQYPLQLTTPFVDEFYSRVTSENSTYDMFDASLATIYRLWINTGSHQMFLIKGIEEFLKSRERLGDDWSVDILESFLVCCLYKEYDLLHNELTIEPSDFVQIEQRMLARLRKEMATFAPPKDKRDGMDTVDMYGEEASAQEEKEHTAANPRVLDTEDTGDLPIDVYYMQKKEELEVRRLLEYHEQRSGILRDIYEEPSAFERTANPFFARLKEIQEKNSMESAADRYLLSGHRVQTTARSSYSQKFLGQHGDARPEIPPDVRRREKDLLQNTLEKLLSANSVTRRNWSEHQECMRKIIIEVRDVVNQVRRNQAIAKKRYKQRLEESRLAVVEHPTTNSKESGAEDVESGDRAREEDPETEKGEELEFDVDKETVEFVSGCGVPSDTGEGYAVLYDPDCPHLPLATLERFEYYLTASNDSLLRALRIDQREEEEL